MCVVSFIGDHYSDKWKKYPYVSPPPTIPDTTIVPNSSQIIFTVGVSREEFEALKKEVQEMKELLIKAKEYDRANNEPDCEMDEKVALLKKIAELVGVDLTEVFG